MYYPACDEAFAAVLSSILLVCREDWQTTSPSVPRFDYRYERIRCNRHPGLSSVTAGQCASSPNSLRVLISQYSSTHCSPAPSLSAVQTAQLTYWRRATTQQSARARQAIFGAKCCDTFIRWCPRLDRSSASARPTTTATAAAPRSARGLHLPGTSSTSHSTALAPCAGQACRARWALSTVPD